MLAIIGDGLLNDLLLSVCAEIGMPLNKPYHVGYVTPTVSYLSLQGIRYLLFFQLLKYVESQIQRKALLVMSGSSTETSFLDKFGFPKGICELRGTQYTLSQPYE